MYGKFGRGGGGGGRGGHQGRMAAPPKSNAASAIPITPRNRKTFGNLSSSKLKLGGGGAPPHGSNSNNTNNKSKGSNTANDIGGSGAGAEETFTLVQPSSSPLPSLAMIIRLVPGLVDQIQRAESQGLPVRVKFGPFENNSTGNIIDVGGKEFRFTWAPESGELCDIYEERQCGELGDGLLVASGSASRKVNVERTLNDSVRENLKMRSEEASRQQRSRKAIVLDHGNSAIKSSKAMSFTNEVPSRKVSLKPVKGPPSKKQKIEADAVVTNKLPIIGKTSPSYQQAQGVAEDLKGQNADDLDVFDELKSEYKEQKDKLTIPEEKTQKQSITYKSEDMRNLLIDQLVDKPKGMSGKALEKAVGESGKLFESILKTIADYRAPGRYVLKAGIRKEGDVKSPSRERSSPECQGSESPVHVDSSTLNMTVRNEEQQLQSSPKEDSDMENSTGLDGHQQEPHDLKTVVSDGSGSSSSSSSGSDSDSDSGSSDSGSDSDGSRSRSRSKSKSPAGSASHSSTDSESEQSSSSGEVSDVNVDIMSDDEKNDNEAESAPNIEVSKPSPLLADRDEYLQNFNHTDIPEKDEGQVPQVSRNSEDVDICDDDDDDDDDIISVAKPYIEKITSDTEGDNEMAVDIDVISEEKAAISPVKGKEEDPQSPCTTKYLKDASDEERIASNDNMIDMSVHQSVKSPKSNSRNEYDSNQSQEGSEKDRTSDKQIERPRKRGWVDLDTVGNRELTPSQSTFDSSVRPDKSVDISPVEKKHADVNKKARMLDGKFSKGFERPTNIGSPLQDKDLPRQSHLKSQTDATKDHDNKEQTIQAQEANILHNRSNDIYSNTENSEFMSKSGKDSVFAAKSSKKNGNLLESRNQNATLSSRKSTINDKHSKYEAGKKELQSLEFRGKDKMWNFKKSYKETENEERHLKSESDSQSKRVVEQCEEQLKDSSVRGESFIQVSEKVTDHPLEESTLKRECSDLELGELREPVGEDPHQPIAAFDKPHNNRIIENKSKPVSEKDTESLKATRSSNGTVLSSKRTNGYQMLQHPNSHHTDIESAYRQERQLDGSTKVPLAEVQRHSVSPTLETHGNSSFPKRSSKNVRKSQNKGKVQPTTYEDKNDLEKPKDNTVLNEKNKEGIKVERNNSHWRKKAKSANESDLLFSKYEKEKPELKGPITNIEQFEEYIHEYEEKYPIYRDLNDILKSDRDDYQKFERDLMSAKDRGDEKLYEETIERVKNAYSRNGLRHKRWKKIFFILHEELKNLKQKLVEFESRY